MAGNKIAITGMGIISCLGCSLDEVAQALRQGSSGIQVDSERAQLGFRSHLTGKVTGFVPAKWGITRKHLRTMCEPATYAYAAAQDAIKDAGITPEHLSSGRTGIIFGNDSTAKGVIDGIDTLREYKETHFIGGGNVFKTMNSTVTMNLASTLGIRGANWTISAACASGAHAIGQALMLIRSGMQDIVLAGGAQETNWASMTSFDALGAFSTHHQSPKEASRPFDKDRDGLVPSGGAACVILESLEHAKARGARIHGLVEGYGFSSDGSGHLSLPTGDGSIRAMQAALKDAAVTADSVDYINAHATSTPAGDLSEAKAIAEVFGLSVPVSSTKSMTGHECWMAGASEVIYTALMAHGGFIAPNINFHGFDEGTPQIQIVRETRDKKMRRAVSNSFGFGGTNSALVLNFE